MIRHWSLLRLEIWAALSNTDNMPRLYQIFGEFIVKLYGSQFNNVLPGAEFDEIVSVELGLTSESTVIVPRFYHQDVHSDDFGTEVPAEVLINLADVNIRMTLVHFDMDVLRICMRMGMGFGPGTVDDLAEDGGLGPCGQPMGANEVVGLHPNRFIRMSLIPARFQGNGFPWRFKSCYLDSRPLEIPVGTERTLVKLSWRAIPYRSYVDTTSESADQQVTEGGGITGEASNTTIGIRSSGCILWDHESDDAGD